MDHTKAEKPREPARSLSPTEKSFLAEHSVCAMCDTPLELRHQINKNKRKVKEEAHCPSCRVRVRSRHHDLQ